VTVQGTVVIVQAMKTCSGRSVSALILTLDIGWA
jgi:hypothetical protein